MANIIDLKLLGDKALQRNIDKLTNAVQKKIVRKALRAEGKLLLADIKARILSIRVTGRHTDPLARLTKLRAIKRSRNRIGVQIVTPTRDELGIPSDAGYWPAHMELGTATNSATSFLRIVANAGKEVRLARIAKGMGNGITAEARKRQKIKGRA